MSKKIQIFFVVITALLLTLYTKPSPAYAAGTVTTCDLPSLTTALSGGGIVDFNTGGSCSISFSSRITISTNTTIQNTSGFTVTFTTPKGGSPLLRVDSGATVNISNIHFLNGGGVSNPGIYNGGAIFIDYSTVNISNSNFNGNFGGSGGAIYNRGGTLTIVNTVFNDNSAMTGGGSILNDGGNVTINNSLFTANSAGTGAGIRNEGNGTAIINNSTFSGNDVSAVYNLYGTATITHSTFSNNTSFLSPSHIYYGTGMTTVTASIFNGGVSDSGGCGGSGAFVDGGHNITFNTTGCLGANMNPRLGVLSGGVHIPANRDIEYAPACVLGTDQQGTSRPQGALCTPGAVEADPPPQSTTVEFSSASGNTFENSNTGAFIRVTTSDTFPTGSAITATISVSGGNASASDYSLVGNIDIPAGTTHNTTISIDPALSIVNDMIAEDPETINLSLSLSSGNLGAQSIYTHTINDDDMAGLVVVNGSLMISEPNGFANFSLSLNSQPTADVTINFTVTDTSECQIIVPNITFNDSTWASAIPITVTAVDDALIDGDQPCDITLSMSTGDSKYGAIVPASVNVTVQDNDIPNAIILIGGDNQQTAINTAFTNALTVQINDGSGQPLEGATVNFTVPSTGASAGLSAYTGLTDVNGQVTVTATANGEVGAYQVLVESGVLTPVNFNLENLDPDVLNVTAICVGNNLEITINTGAPNFDITGKSGADLPQLNVPLGTYTFTGPDTWVGVTIAELAGDLETFTLPNITCNVIIIAPPIVQAPPPPVPDRCDIRGYSLEMPIGIFCTDLFENGQFTIAGSVPANLASSVIDAVDVGKFNGERTISGEFGVGLPICLEGQGRLFFLDASTSPRAQFELTTFFVDGRTCGFIINGGTVVLIR